METSKNRGLMASLALGLTPVAMLLVQPSAWGQEARSAANAATNPAAATTGRSDDLQEVVVTGIRAGLRSAVEVKRDAIQVVDAISAEDIGDFPDKNMGEALQRITGVQITRQDGEGRGVSIRGGDPGLNRVEINGITLLSETVGGGRDVDFRDLPVEFVSRLEVIKSATPDMTEGGVGGTVRIVTRRPFDSPEPYLAASTQMVYSDLANSYDPKFSLIGSRLFFDDKFGVLLGANFERRHLNSNNARTTGWLRRAPTASGAGATPGRGTDVNGDGTLDWVPDLPRDIMDRRVTKRPAFMGIFEFRPSDSMTFYAEGTYAKAKEEVSSMFLQLAASGGLIDYANTRLGADNTITHIELTSSTAFPMDLAYRNINGTLDRQEYSTAIGGKWNLDNWNFDGRVTYAATHVQNDEKNSTATVFGVPRAVVDYTGGQRAPNLAFPGLDITSGQLVNNLAAVFNPRTNTQDEKAAQFNVEYKPQLNWLTSIKGGVDVRELTMDSILFQRTIQLSSRTPTPASTGATTTVPVAQSVIQNIVDTYSGVNPIRFFDTGDVGYSGGVQFWNDNRDATYDATIAASGLTLDPHGVNVNPLTNGTFQGYLDTWSVEEKTKAAYAQASFALETALPVKGTLGVRYVDTDTSSSGFNRVQTSPTVALFPQETRDGGYKKWLPSLNARIDITDKVVGRLTAGKVLARPSPSQLALRRTLDAAINFQGSRGNPDLQPFEANQYDLGVEWYFAQDGFASITAFRKEISQFIINLTSEEDTNQQPCDRATAPLGSCFSITRPVNGNDNVTINGVEAGVQYAFDFLPAPFNGFGALANITYQKDRGYKQADVQQSGRVLPFPGLSRTSYNTSLYYEVSRWSVRASYNWRKKWLITPSGRGGLPEFNEDFGSLDGSASFNFTPDISVFLEGINLMDEVRIENNSDVRRIGNETYGRRFFLGVRAKF